jgi:hypothetical protein
MPIFLYTNLYLNNSMVEFHKKKKVHASYNLVKQHNCHLIVLKQKNNIYFLRIQVKKIKL